MQIKNSLQNYGIVTKLTHAVLALLFISQFIIIYWRHQLPNGSSFGLDLLFLHKSIGFSLLFIALFFALWRFFNIKPVYPKNMLRIEAILATATHHSLYLVAILMPLTGTLMSFMSGKGIKWFGYTVPNLFTINEKMAGFFYDSHVYLSYIAITLVLLHFAGALKHYYISKDNILQRMWR